jgi:riboflavin kinase
LIQRKEWRNIFTLIKLAELGALRRTTKISTEYLADKLGFSQQTASRQLIELEKTNLIDRQISPEGSIIKITAKGLECLSQLQTKLQRLIEIPQTIIFTLEGTVFRGLGEGAYYISKDSYKKQFIKKLGFNPYPGTLNLKLKKDYDLKIRKDLDAYPAIKIKGFVSENRTFGLVKCYKVRIENKIDGALVFARRSHYDLSVLEIVAPVYLRKELNLSEGQKVKIEIFIP